MLKVLQARLQQYMNHELPDVQAGFRKGRGTKDQIANIQWIIEKAREFQKNICGKQTCVGSLRGEDPLETTHSGISCLENPMDRGAWQATVHGVTRVENEKPA